MNKLPLIISHERGSISTVRALKQILELLRDVEPSNNFHEDRLNASIDDVETMLDSTATGLPAFKNDYPELFAALTEGLSRIGKVLSQTNVSTMLDFKIELRLSSNEKVHAQACTALESLLQATKLDMEEYWLFDLTVDYAEYKHISLLKVYDDTINTYITLKVREAKFV